MIEFQPFPKVPRLEREVVITEKIDGFFMPTAEMDSLQMYGSQAAPGFMNPEGIMVYHTAARQMFKRTFEHDDNGKEAA